MAHFLKKKQLQNKVAYVVSAVESGCDREAKTHSHRSKSSGIKSPPTIGINFTSSIPTIGKVGINSHTYNRYK